MLNKGSRRLFMSSSHGQVRQGLTMINQSVSVPLEAQKKISERLKFIMDRAVIVWVKGEADAVIIQIAEAHNSARVFVCSEDRTF